MHVLIFDIWMTVLDYNTNPTVIILVGIRNLAEMHVLIFDIWMTVLDNKTNPTGLPKCMFYLLVSGLLYQTIIPIPQ